ncbi:MAG: protein kinase, partial [bacterium]
EALQEAHEHDIIHRDIKSENIMVTPKGQVKVMDFGLVKLKGIGGLTKNGTTMGTISYMSPEQARGEDVDHRTDIWSFGVVLYEMITGQLPFKGDYEQAVIYSIMNEEPKPITGLRSGVPLELEWITNKALAKNTNERYQNVDEIIIDLKQLVQESTSTGMPKITRSTPKKSIKSRLIKFTIPGIVLIGLVIAFFILRPLLLKDVIKSEPKPVAVLPFENLTGDSSYNILQKSISNLLIAKLEQSKHLRVTTWERMRDLLKQMGKGNMEIVDMDQETSYALCRMDGVDAAITGSFSKMGQMFAIELKILDVTSKRILLSETSQGEGENSIFEQIDELTRAISKGFGLRRRKEEPIAKPIEELTTHSMEAYNYFIIGRENYEKVYYNDALQFFEKALQVDSTFAVAYLWLGKTLGSLGKDEARKIAFEKAKAYSVNVSEKEKLYIEAFYAEYLENDLDKKFDILKQLVAEFPRDKWSHQLLAAHYDGMKLFDKAIEEYKKVLELDPNHGSSINELAYLYLQLGNFDKAIEYLERYKSLNPGDANPYDSLGDIYLRMGKFDKAIANYKMAIDIKPDFDSNRKIAYLFALNEDFFEAIKWIDRYMSSSKTHRALITGHLYKGFQYAWLGKIDMSFIELNKSQEFSKEDFWFRSFVEYIKGHVYFDRGAFENSRKCFQEWYRLVLYSQ